MSRISAHKILRGLGAIVVVVATTVTGAVASAQGAAAALGAPKVVPGLRNWAPAGEGYTFAAGARVVAEDAALSDTARMFAAELHSLTGLAVPWQVGGAPRAGDLRLRVGAAAGGAEGYRLTVAPVLTIQGAGAGVYYGTRTVLQLLRQNRSLPGGTADDWPLYPERGLLLDAGRKYFTVPWLRDRIRDMSYLKMNHLHLHLNDVHGFRLESESHPEITSAEHYTKQEIRDLIDYAAARNVRILPELDFPGHMDAILNAHPELRLVSKTGQVQPGFIDLSKPAAYELIEDLIREYLPLFPSEYFHIGGDEYVTNYDDFPQLADYARAKYGPNATGKDAYLGFINWANEIVRSAGKTTRAWNDGLKPGGSTLTVNPNIIIEHWSMSGPPPWIGPAYNVRQLIAAGHRVHNSTFTPTYFATGGWAALFNAHPAFMYDTWDPSLFVDGTRLSDAERPYNLGSKLHVFCDDPNALTEEQIAQEIHYRLRVMAQHTWRTPSPWFYTLFIPVMNAVGTAPEIP
ncbi:family 20 glycosylhydrolase [Actinokineospora sp. HUAS TT18]|uniref:family 20 glycosylhydrolase n=1 Tax=Actinokineospora sp. HUAS TT18 TaxID=3447451 RepID=UPI003F51B30A